MLFKYIFILPITQTSLKESTFLLNSLLNYNYSSYASTLSLKSFPQLSKLSTENLKAQEQKQKFQEYKNQIS